MTDRPIVVIAMSGGVDSSVAAGLLVQQGYPVIGMMLRLWNEPGQESANRCCTPESMALARRVARKFEIPFYAVDVREIFRQTVVQSFIDGYAQGVTPNPCLVCNRQIRWGRLLAHARSLGAEFLATGHYARVDRPENGPVRLLRGQDPDKDQSYILSGLNQQQLSQALFPVGGYTKQAVRELAREFDLPVAEQPDSQDLCFITAGDYRDFLRRHAPQVEKPGPILDIHGQQLGHHKGLAFYTIGQRRGLGLSSPAPLYVIRKDLDRNALIVGAREHLGAPELLARDVNWIAGRPPSAPIQASVKIRYKSREQTARISPLPDERVHVRFATPLPGITPGQLAAFYHEDLCLGGGIIERAGSDLLPGKEPLSAIHRSAPAQEPEGARTVPDGSGA